MSHKIISFNDEIRFCFLLIEVFENCNLSSLGVKKKAGYMYAQEVQTNFLFCGVTSIRQF